MILSIKLSDETYEKYGKINPENPRLAVEQVAEKFSDVGSGKTVILTGALLSRLQTLLGEQIDTPEGFEASIKRLVTVKVGEWEVALSPSQRKGIDDVAKFSGQPRELIALTKIKQGLIATLGV